MNCIIVDDDKVFCKVLEGFIANYQTLNLVGTFNNSLEARNTLAKRTDIDLVFLDVLMPEMSGFDFIQSLDFPPNIIICSSTEGYAIKAYDYNVADYLLKPITYGRFCKAVDKVIRYFSRKSENSSEKKEIFIKNGASLVKLQLKDIVYVEALENYVNIYTASDKYTIHFTMKAIANIIPSNVFVRIQRSYIVNKTMIQSITDSTVELYNGKSIISLPLGKSFRDNLLNDINVMTK